MNSTRLISLADFAPVAERFLPNSVRGYVNGGTEDGLTLAANREAFQRVQFRPRGLVNVECRDQGVSIFGQRFSSPIGVAPMGITAMCRYECELALAKAAREEGVPFILSGMSTVSLERVAKEQPNLWYQGYLAGDKGQIGALLDRLTASNVKVLVVTIDTAVNANRENNVKAGFGVPFKFSWALFRDGLAHPRWTKEVFLRTLWRDRAIPRFRNVSADTSGLRVTDEPSFRGGRERLDWHHIEWIRERWRGQVVLKGVAHPDDARRAANIGIDGVVVSNHGGRQLDGVQGTLDMLPDIVSAVAGRCTVMIDGGFRRGTDVLKAIALGAKMVFLGRPLLYGAIVDEERGVRRVLQLFKSEIDRNMALLGCPALNDVDHSVIARLGTGAGAISTSEEG